jgi:hypothetical protein
VALAARRPRPPKGLRESAIQVAVEAAGADIGLGIPWYDPDRDERVRAVPSFADWAARLRRLRRIRRLYGVGEADRLALAWVYQVPRSSSPAEGWVGFWREITNPIWSYFGIANLENFTTADDPIEIDAGLSIRLRTVKTVEEFTGWDRDQIERVFGWNPNSLTFGRPAHHVVISAHDLPKTPDNVVLTSTGGDWPRVQRLLLALRLAGPGEVLITRLYQGRREPLGLSGGTASSIPWVTSGPGDQYDLSANRLLEVHDMYARLADFDESHRSRLGHIGTALDRFTAIFDRPFPKVADRLIDDIIALEAIVGTSDELAFTIGFRVSGMLEVDDTARLALFRDLKSFYSTRSDLVHGSRLGTRAVRDLQREAELRNVVRRFLRGVLRVIGTRYDPTQAWMKQPLDDLLLVTDERVQLVAAMNGSPHMA